MTRSVLYWTADGQSWWFVYPSEHSARMLSMVGATAADPGTSFGWYDAVIVAVEIRRMAREDESAGEPVFPWDMFAGSVRDG